MLDAGNKLVLEFVLAACSGVATQIRDHRDRTRTPQSRIHTRNDAKEGFLIFTSHSIRMQHVFVTPYTSCTASFALSSRRPTFWIKGKVVAGKVEAAVLAGRIICARDGDLCRSDAHHAHQECGKTAQHQPSSQHSDVAEAQPQFEPPAGKCSRVS